MRFVTIIASLLIITGLLSYKLESEAEAVNEEIMVTEIREGDGMAMVDCVVVGHDHPPLPAVTVTYSD